MRLSARRFIGSLAALLAGGRALGVRLALYIGAACAAVAVAYGQVELRVHSIAEVVCGLLIGVAAAALFVALRGPPRRLSAYAANVAACIADRRVVGDRSGAVYRSLDRRTPD